MKMIVQNKNEKISNKIRLSERQSKTGKKKWMEKKTGSILEESKCLTFGCKLVMRISTDRIKKKKRNKG